MRCPVTVVHGLWTEKHFSFEGGRYQGRVDKITQLERAAAHAVLAPTSTREPA